MISDELISLVSSWQSRIRAFFRRRCHNPSDVDDLAQEAVASIIRCYPAFAHRSAVSTWVYAVCRNVFSNYLYYRGRESRLHQRLSRVPPAADPPSSLELREALARLPGDERTLYALHYVEGRSIRAIAATLGRPEGTVKYLLHVLRRHVRQLLDA
jgi:RNA polymerase sigma-70 factor (ECF subfamily)